MKTVGYITVWILLGCIIEAPIYFLKLNIRMEFLPSVAFLGCLFSINFASMSACTTAMLKFKEIHQTADCKPVISEMKDNTIAMLVGIVCTTICFILREIVFQYNIPVIFYIAESMIYSVFIMFFWLIFDVILAFLEMVGK